MSELLGSFIVGDVNAADICWSDLDGDGCADG